MAVNLTMHACLVLEAALLDEDDRLARGEPLGARVGDDGPVGAPQHGHPCVNGVHVAFHNPVSNMCSILSNATDTTLEA